MSIYRTAVKNPVTTALIFVAFIVFGVFSLINTSIAQFPDFDANTIMVMSSYDGANAQDIESNVTKILENSLNGVENLKKLTSQSKENISLLTLTFEYGTDIEEATNNVRDKLDMVTSMLPDEISKPVIFKFSADDMPIMLLSATADESLPGLDKILDDKLSTPLARVPGVGTISVVGAPTREIQVYCDPSKLASCGLSINAIASVIAAENRNLPSGNIDVGSDNYSLRVEGELKDPSELLDIVVGAFGDKPVYLRDVATIHDGSEEKEQESYTDGVRSARIVIQKQTGANTVNVLKRIKKELPKIQKTLPEDVQIKVIVDGSRNIINSIKSLRDTIVITFIVVMLVVLIFLGDWRSTIIIVLSIPIALLASLVYLYATGNTLNIVSMSALSIAIGMVVDDAIVVLENVTTHLQRGEKATEAAVHGTSEVGISVVASTLTMLCVFIPLTMISGMAGIMFKQLGWIVSIIMIVSTTAALTLVPMLCSKMLNVNAKHGTVYNKIFIPINSFLDRISAGYARLINWAMNHRKPVILGALAIFVAVVGILGPKTKTELFARNDDGRITVSIELPRGTSQTVTSEFAAGLVTTLRSEIPEIQILNSSFGQADSDNAWASMQNNGSHVIALNINIGSITTRKRSCAEVADQIRGVLNNYPEIRKALVTEGGGGMGGASSVDVEVYGYSFEDTDWLARVFQAELKKSPVFAQVTLSRDEYTPEYQVVFDRTKLALNGLNSSTAGSAFSAAMNGAATSYYREDGEEYKIRVRYAPEFRHSVEDIGNTIIYNAAGQAVRLKEIADIVETLVPPTIERKDRERLITVKCIMARGAALSEGVEVAQKVIDATAIPNNLSVVIAGSFEDQQDMFKDLIVLMILMVILIYMVMASQFESFLSPFVIMFSVPFAIVGVLLGLWVTNSALGAMGLIGLIILLGIVVKNGIVLIDYTILCRERGMSVRDASVTAARSRLRPILMTTLTTVLGMVPMAVGQGEGAEMWRSLGMVVCWGLTISTVVTLLLIPTIYCSLSLRQERRKMKKLAAK